MRATYNGNGVDTDLDRSKRARLSSVLGSDPCTNVSMMNNTTLQELNRLTSICAHQPSSTFSVPFGPTSSQIGLEAQIQRADDLYTRNLNSYLLDQSLRNSLLASARSQSTPTMQDLHALLLREEILKRVNSLSTQSNNLDFNSLLALGHQGLGCDRNLLAQHAMRNEMLNLMDRPQDRLLAQVLEAERPMQATATPGFQFPSDLLAQASFETCFPLGGRMSTSLPGVISSSDSTSAATALTMLYSQNQPPSSIVAPIEKLTSSELRAPSSALDGRIQLSNVCRKLSTPQEAPSTNASTTNNKRKTPPASVSYEGDRLFPVATSSEEWVMSQYQCLLRQQIMYVESSATARNNEGKTQGRNKPIVPGQVGILCKHCSQLAPQDRPRGAIYFPAKLHRIYQAAQNMAHNHFADSCKAIPEATRQQLLALKEQKAVTVGAGKEYWYSSAVNTGIRESENGLFLTTKDASL